MKGAFSRVIQNLLLLLLGWFLGLASPIIVDAFGRRREVREFRNSLRMELEELQYRLAMNVWVIKTRAGSFDRALLSWFKAIEQKYKGLNKDDRLAGVTDKLLAATDEEFQQLAQFGRSPSDTALGLKKLSAPLLESRFSSLSLLEAGLQNRLLEIRTYLSSFNEDVDQCRYFMQLTFTGGISVENHRRAEESLKQGQLSAAQIAEKIVNQIGLISW